MGPEQTTFIMNCDAQSQLWSLSKRHSCTVDFGKYRRTQRTLVEIGQFGMRKVLSGKRGRLVGQRCEGYFQMPVKQLKQARCSSLLSPTIKS